MDKNIRKWFCSMGESRTLLAPTGELRCLWLRRSNACNGPILLQLMVLTPMTVSFPLNTVSV